MALNKNIAKAIKRIQENELLKNNKLIAEFIKWYNSDGKVVYPFNEGDDYWTIEDGDVVWSCWDSVSEELFGKNPKAKATIAEIETDAIAQFNEIMNEHYNEYIKQYNKHNGFTCDNCLEQKTNDQYNHQRSFGKHYQICNDCVSAVFSF